MVKKSCFKDVWLHSVISEYSLEEFNWLIQIGEDETCNKEGVVGTGMRAWI